MGTGGVYRYLWAEFINYRRLTWQYLFPVSAFVAAGFEHSIANMYFIPMGMLLKASAEANVNMDMISWFGLFKNLVPVIMGNLVGGSMLVGIVYYIICLRAKPEGKQN